MDHDSEAVAAGATGGGVTEAPAEADLRVAIPTAFHVAPARAQMRDWLRRRLRAEEADEVLLACGEAVDNALEYGSSPITVEMNWNGHDEQPSLAVVIHDTGTWRVAAKAGERGMGIPIMTALMDSLTIETRNGTAVRLSRRF